MYIQKSCKNIWLVKLKCLTLPPSSSERAGATCLTNQIKSFMAHTLTKKVQWVILQDSDGRVFLSSSLGVRRSFANLGDADEAFTNIVDKTTEVFRSLIECGKNTIKFTVEY